MAIKLFRDRKFKAESLVKIEHMREIVADYESQGLRLTARQLYYQFVTKNLITNEERSYKNLTSLLTDARYAGMIDWDAIEDRGRVATIWQEFDNVTDCVNEALRSYRRRRWEDQPNYVELWVEKQALAGVLEPMAMEYHVPLMVNKGYSSASAMHESAMRFLARQERGQSPILLYLGDHDPSGEDMVRDIKDRLVEFGVTDLEVIKVALTMAQIEEHEPPPNPAKTTDSRYSKYALEHGKSSWEVDALPPNVLQELIREALDERLDGQLWGEVIEREGVDKDKLRAAAKRIDR